MASEAWGDHLGRVTVTGLDWVAEGLLSLDRAGGEAPAQQDEENEEGNGHWARTQERQDPDTCRLGQPPPTRAEVQEDSWGNTHPESGVPP